MGPEAYRKHPTWLRTGLKRLKARVGRNNEYVFVEGLMMGGKPGMALVIYAQAVAASAEMMEMLRGEGGHRLIPH